MGSSAENSSLPILKQPAFNKTIVSTSGLSDASIVPEGNKGGGETAGQGQNGKTPTMLGHKSVF